MANDRDHRFKKAFDKGMELFNKKNYEKAFEKFVEAISLDYLDVSSHVFKARALCLKTWQDLKMLTAR